MAVNTDPWLGPQFSQLIGNLLKEYHLPGIIEVDNFSSILLYRMEKGAEDVSGSAVNQLVHIGRSEGHGATKRRRPLPNAHRQRYTRMVFPLRFYYGQIMVPGPEMAETRDPAGAYGEILSLESNGLVRDITKRRNQIAWSDGSGRRAIVTDVSQMASGILGIRLVHDEADQAPTINTLHEESMIAIVDASASTTATPVFIDFGGGVRQAMIGSIDQDAKQIVLTDVRDDAGEGGPGTTYVLSGIQEGDAIVTCNMRDNTARTSAGMLDVTSYRHSTSTSNPTIIAESGVEEMGMMGFFGEGNVFGGYNAGLAYGVPLQGIDSSTGNSWFRAGVFDNGGTLRTIDPLLMQKPVDWIQNNGSSPTAIYCNYGQRLAYLSTFGAQREWSNVMELDGGYRALNFNGLPLIVDPDCPVGRMFYADESTFKEHRTANWHWIEDPSVLVRVQGYDLYVATLGKYSERGLNRRNVLALISDLVDY